MSQSRVLKNESEYTIVAVPDTKPEKRYAINKKPFAQGGFGKIYKAYPIEKKGEETILHEDQVFVAKTMLGQVSDLEIECLQKFHEGEQPIYVSDEAICIYKFREGEDLGPDSQEIAVGEGSYFKEFPTNIDKERLQIKIKVILEIAQKIKLLHDQGILHGDIKLSNIRICIKGDKVEVHLLDFGSARKLSIDPNQISIVDEGYSSTVFPPEYGVDRHLCLKSDIFSFAAVILSILGAHHPLLSAVFGVPAIQQERELSGYPALASKALFFDKLFSNLRNDEKGLLQIDGLNVKKIVTKFLYRMNSFDHSYYYKRASYKDRPSIDEVCIFFAALNECLEGKNPLKNNENIAKMVLLSVGAWDKRHLDVEWWSAHEELIPHIISQAKQQNRLTKKLGILLEQNIAIQKDMLISLMSKKDVLVESHDGILSECKKSKGLDLKKDNEAASEKIEFKDVLEPKNGLKQISLQEIKKQYNYYIQLYRTTSKGIAREGALHRIDELFKALEQKSALQPSDPHELSKIMMGCLVYEASQAQKKHSSQFFVRYRESRLFTILDEIIKDQWFVNRLQGDWRRMPFSEYQGQKDILENIYLRYSKSEAEELRSKALAAPR